MALPVTLEEHLASVKATKNRTTYCFKFPQTVPGDMRSVVLAELTAEEELQATRRCQGDQFRLAYELIKQSLVEIDGKKVGLEDGTVDVVMERMHPKARRLLIDAYTKINTPSEEESALFLRSAETKVE